MCDASVYLTVCLITSHADAPVTVAVVARVTVAVVGGTVPVVAPVAPVAKDSYTGLCAVRASVRVCGLEEFDSAHK